MNSATKEHEKCHITVYTNTNLIMQINEVIITIKKAMISNHWQMPVTDDKRGMVNHKKPCL